MVVGNVGCEVTRRAWEIEGQPASYRCRPGFDGKASLDSSGSHVTRDEVPTVAVKLVIYFDLLKHLLKFVLTVTCLDNRVYLGCRGRLLR